MGALLARGPARAAPDVTLPPHGDSVRRQPRQVEQSEQLVQWKAAGQPIFHRGTAGRFQVSLMTSAAQAYQARNAVTMPR